MHKSSAKLMDFTDTLRWRSVFGLSFGFLVLASLLIVYLLGPVLGVSQTMGGTQHDGYLELATNLSQGKGYVFTAGGNPVIHRPPAFVFLLVPGTYLPEYFQRIYIILLNAVLAAGTAVLLYRLAYSLSGTAMVAGIAVILLVTNPWVIWSVKNPMSPILQMFCYLSMACLAFNYLQKPFDFHQWRTIVPAIGLGAACGVGSLSHGVMLPTSIFILSMVAAVAVWRGERFKLPGLYLSLVVIICFVGPWTLRNHLVTGRLIPVVGNSGVAYFGGNAYWGITKPPVQADEDIFIATLRHAGVHLPPESVFHFWGLKNPALDAQLSQAMVSHIKRYPLSFLKKVCLNAMGFFFPITHRLIIPPFEADGAAGAHEARFLGPSLEAGLISIYYGAVLLLAASTIFRFDNSRLGRWGVCLVLMASVLFALPYFPFLTFVGHNLYVFGTLPFIYILAADALVGRTFKS
jgi:4-amino-4-deoxy-L-arabinose transferase-like glycosyltransferase